jgi:NADH:ubiquinone oxidoreductase subunit 6 (subunit J)
MVNTIESIVVGSIHNVLGFGHSYSDFFAIFSLFFMKYSIVFSAIMVVISINAIYSVFFLILLFINVAILVIALGAEFLGITFIIVYVGAIAVLFLFVVMMLNINQVEISESNQTSFLYFVSAFLLLILFAKYLTSFVYNGFGFNSLLTTIEDSLTPIYSFEYKDWASLVFKTDNILVLGSLLYTYYFHLFILAGFILLLAMVSSIALTLNYTSSPKSQDKYMQITRQLNQIVQI